MLRASFVNNPWGSRVLSSPLGQQHANTTFTATLVGTDAVGSGGVLAQWRFRITTRPAFKTTSLWESEGKAQLEKAASQYASQYTVGETYTLAQPSMPRADMFTNYANNAADQIKYSLKFLNLTSGNEAFLPFYINAEGESLAQPKLGDIGTYTAVLAATDAVGAEASVFAWNFSVVAKKTFTTRPGWDPLKEGKNSNKQGSCLSPGRQ